MTINQSSGGGNTTVTITYTATTANMQNFLGDAAKYLYDKISGHGVVLASGETVDDLTNAEIGAIIDTYVKKVILDAAKVYHVESAAATAQATAQTENTTRYF